MPALEWSDSSQKIGYGSRSPNMVGVNGHYLVPKDHMMAKKQNSSRSLNKDSHVIMSRPSGSATQDQSRGGGEMSVTPKSARIIKATSVKRRTAMKVLANR